MKNDVPMISIVIPVYNSEEFLPSCLSYLDKQTSSDFEVILVDDGSTDGSPMICDEFARNHTNAVVVHADNSGQYMARQTGISIAKGEYVMFCDSDDCLRKDAIETIGAAIAHYQPDIVSYKAHFGGKPSFDMGNHDGVGLHPGLYENASLHQVYKAICSGTMNSLWTKAIRRTLLQQKTPENSDRLRHGEDLFQVLQAVGKLTSFYQLPDCLYFYRDNPSGISRDYHPCQIESLSIVYALLLKQATLWGESCIAAAQSLVASSVLSYIFSISQEAFSVAEKLRHMCFLYSCLGSLINWDVLQSAKTLRVDSYIIVRSFLLGHFLITLGLPKLGNAAIRLKRLFRKRTAASK